MPRRRAPWGLRWRALLGRRAKTQLKSPIRFAIQSDISEEILAAVDVGIGDAEAQRLARKPARSFTATDAIWRGLYHVNRGSREDNQEARRLFERAIELDPEVAAVYAFLGNTYFIELTSGWSSDAALLDRAEALAKRALELDASVANGHEALAFVYFSRGRTKAALVEIERAVELASNDASARALRGLILADEGRFLEATRDVKRALRLNPRPSSFLQLITAYVNYGASRHEEAIELLERVRLENPDNLIARIALAVFYGRAGRREEARAAVREALQVAPDLTSERALQLLPGLESIAGPEEFARTPDYLRAAGLP